MREVTVYTVQAHQTFATGSYVEYFKQVQMPPLLGVKDDDSKTFILPEDIPLPKRIALKVHHINRLVMSADGVPRRQEEFLAIDRDLLRVLEIVVRSDAGELRQEVARLQKKHDHVTALYYDLESRQDAFRAAPLWRRLWIAIRPGRYFT